MENKRSNITQALVITSLSLVIAAVVLSFYNFILKKEKRRIETAPYYYKAKDLARLSKERNPEVPIVLNDEIGKWDRDENKNLQLIKDLAIGGPGETDPIKQFYRAAPVFADNDGNIYVGEYADGTIKKFNKDGDYLITIAGQGNGPGEISFIFWALIDQHNIINVIDRGNQRISYFDRDGRFLKSYQIENSQIKRPTFILANDMFIISYYDHKSEKVIHTFDKKGKYIDSFGESVIFYKPISHLFHQIPSQISSGRMCHFKNKLYFTRLNPYEIHIFNLNGVLEKKIFRKNAFMPPVSVEIMGKDNIRYSVFPNSMFLGILENHILNYIWFPPIHKRKVYGIIDLFDMSGKLLTSLKFNKKIVFHSIDKYGNLYGVENYDGEPEIVRYKLKINKNLAYLKPSKGGELN